MVYTSKGQFQAGRWPMVLYAQDNPINLTGVVISVTIRREIKATTGSPIAIA